jgi:hypothetical protein
MFTSSGCAYRRPWPTPFDVFEDALSRASERFQSSYQALRLSFWEYSGRYGHSDCHLFCKVTSEAQMQFNLTAFAAKAHSSLLQDDVFVRHIS